MKNLVREGYHFFTLKMLFPWQYRRYSRRPFEKKKLVFIEANLPELSNSLKRLYQELENRGGYELKVHCLQEISVSKLTYVKNAMDCLKDMATAKGIFYCEGSRLVSCIQPRKETVIIQTWHGCGAFKKFGMSTSELLFGGNLREHLKYPYYKNPDCVTVSSPEVIWAYEEAMGFEKGSSVVLPLGVSRTDCFFQQDYLEQAKRHVQELLPEIGNKKIILYAPTFRNSVGSASAPDALDIGMLAEALAGEYVLLIKQHPLVKHRPEIETKLRSFAIDVSDRMGIEELLCVSSICISDYSSLVFEYSLLERPMIFFAYDLEDYNDWRGFYYDYEELTPGPVVRTTEEILAYIQNLEERFDPKQVRDFREKFMSSCDGHSTQRIIEWMETNKKESM